MNHRIGAEALPIGGAAAGGAGLRGWRFDGFVFDLQRRELRSPGGAVVTLRPKAEALLCQFLLQPGHLFSREELMAVLWPATVVTDDSLVQCVGELRTALDDRSQRMIQTLPRRGYRWEAKVEPVMDLPEMADAPGPARAPGLPAGDPADRRAGSGWLLGLGVLTTVAALVWAGGLVPALTSKPLRIDDAIAARSTVAVMPFVVAGDDAELRQAAEAVADEIAAQFATRVGMKAIGRAATAGYEGATPPLARIASTLKATHVLTGHVERAAGGAALSVDVQLMTAPGGEVFWTKHFERAAAERVDMAGDVGRQVVNAMRNGGGRARNGDPAPAQGPLDAVELTLLGWRELDRRKSLDDFRRARTRFEAALREDADSVIALNGLATSYFYEFADPRGERTAEQVAELERVVDRARSLRPEDPSGLMMWGSVQLMRGRPDLALPALEKARRLAPSYPSVYVSIGQTMLMLGRTEEVQAACERAIELGAGDPRRVSNAYLLAGEAALMLGDDDRAYGLISRSVATLPANARAHAALAAMDALAGRADQAAAEVAATVALWPNATVARYDELNPSTHPVYLAQRQRLYEGLRQAGFAEK